MIYKTLHIINEHLRFKQNTNKQTKQKNDSILVIAQYWEEAIQPVRQLLPSIGRKPFSQYVSYCLVLGGSHSANTLVVAQCWEEAIQPVCQLLPSVGGKPFSQYVSCCLVLGGSHSASTLRRFLTSRYGQLLIIFSFFITLLISNNI